MKKKFFRIFLVFGVTLFVSVFQSCDKQHAKDLSGIYNCQVHYLYWDMMPTNKDSTYNEQLEVLQDGKYINVLNYKIHIDSLWNGKEYYTGYIHDYFKVKFTNDSLYATRSSGGLGGNASWTYKGIK